MNLEEYERIENQVQDVRFGVINIYMNKQDSDDLVMEKTRPSKSKEDHNFNHLQAEQRMRIEHVSILKMICATRNDETWETRAYFEYPNEDLYDRRSALTSPAEIMKFLTHLLEGLVYLQEHRFVHGDLRPEYVFYDARKARYILLDRLGDPSSYSQAQRNNLVYENKNIFMSPAMFNQLSRGAQRVEHNPFKSEVFALGMVLLSMFTDDVDLGMCYNRMSKQFDVLHFKSIFMDLNKHFFSGKIERLISDFLFDCMLNLDEKVRLSPRKCLHRLRYEVAPAMLRELEKHQMELRMRETQANREFQKERESDAQVESEEASRQTEPQAQSEEGRAKEEDLIKAPESGTEEQGLAIDFENEGFMESNFFDSNAIREDNAEGQMANDVIVEGDEAADPGDSESDFDRESGTQEMFQSKVEIDNSSRQMKGVEDISGKSNEESFDLTAHEQIGSAVEGEWRGNSRKQRTPGCAEFGERESGTVRSHERRQYKRPERCFPAK